ncbi:MAG: PH domain-containing protein [Acidimicrobiales bacterium]
MPFPPDLLNESEEVVLDLRPHWAKLFFPVVFVVLAIAATAAAGILDAPRAVQLVLLVLLAVAVVFLLARYVRWTTTNFVVTNERLIHRAGVVAKNGIEIPLDRVQTIRFSQSVFERMLGAGDLLIESAGETGQNTFNDIRKPSMVQNIIYREIEAYENRRVDRMAGARGPAGPAGLSVAEQLEKLHQLLQQGGINQVEYEAQKARLLS